MKKSLNFIKGLFSAESDVSSKRFIVILLTIWFLAIGTYYIIAVQGKGPESNTTISLLQFALGSAVSIAVGGTAAEALKNKMKKKDDEKAE